MTLQNPSLGFEVYNFLDNSLCLIVPLHAADMFDAIYFSFRWDVTDVFLQTDASTMKQKRLRILLISRWRQHRASNKQVVQLPSSHVCQQLQSTHLPLNKMAAILADDIFNCVF